MGLNFFTTMPHGSLEEVTVEEMAYQAGLLVLVQDTPSNTVPGEHVGCSVEMQLVPSKEVEGGQTGRPWAIHLRNLSVDKIHGNKPPSQQTRNAVINSFWGCNF